MPTRKHWFISNELFRQPSDQVLVWIGENVRHSNIAVPAPITANPLSYFSASAEEILHTLLNEIAVNVNDEMSAATRIADTTLARIKAV